MAKKLADVCDVCENPLDGGHMSWQGEPFSRNATKMICLACVSCVVPKVIKRDDNDPGIAITGTYGGDLYSLSDVIAEGFDKKRAKVSLRAVGQTLGFPPKTIRSRIDQ